MSKGEKKLSRKRKREEPPALPERIEDLTPDIEKSEDEPAKKSVKSKNTKDEANTSDDIKKTSQENGTIRDGIPVAGEDVSAKKKKKQSKKRDKAEGLKATNGDIELDATNDEEYGERDEIDPPISPVKKKRQKESEKKTRTNGPVMTEKSAFDSDNENQNNTEENDDADVEGSRHSNGAGTKKKPRFIVFVGASSPTPFKF